MVQRLAPLLEIAEVESSEAFNEYEASPLSRGYRYLDMVRSIPIPAGKACRLLRSTRSSTRSSSDSSISSIASSGMSSRATNSKLEREALVVRELAFRMVRDGFTQALIVAFGRNPSVLERWFSELDIDHALRIVIQDDGTLPSLQDSDGHQVRSSMWRWTRALILMTEAISATQRHLHGERLTADGGGRDGEAAVKILISDTNKVTTAPDDWLQGLQLARFVVASMSKMLSFANALATMELQFFCPIAEKLWMLLNLHACVSGASETLVPSLIEESHRLLAWREMRRLISLQEESRWVAASREMRSLVDRMESDFSMRKDKLGEVILSMMQDANACILSKDSWVPMPDNGKVHKTTKSTLEYVNVLWVNNSVLNSIVWRFFESWHHTTTTNLIAAMIRDLELRLEEESKSLQNPSLRYIFLLNNLDYIKEEINKFQFHSPSGHVLCRDSKLKSYIKSYLYVSWDPVVSCLQSNKATIPCLFPDNRFPLEKFQSKLKATCNTQKFWKVPNPKLRKRLREAISNKVIGAYKDFVEDHPEQKNHCGDLTNFSSPQDLEDMLTQLFEG